MRFHAESHMSKTTIATAIEVQMDYRIVVAITYASVVAVHALTGLA